MSPRRAFSMVELLVVIGILTVLIGILIPTVSSARRHSMAIKCMSNVRQLGNGFQTYLTTESHGIPFVRGGNDNWSENGTSDPHFFWMYCVGKYVARLKESDFSPAAIAANLHEPLFTCPEATRLEDALTGTGQTRTAFARTDTAWWAYRPSWTGPFAGTYGFNWWLYNMPGTTDRRYWMRPAVANGSSNIPVFVDCAWAEIQPLPTDAAPTSIVDPYFAYRTTGTAPSSMARAALNRHLGPSVNVAFLDGSARRVTLRELWSLNWYRGWALPDALPAMPKS